MNVLPAPLTASKPNLLHVHIVFWQRAAEYVRGGGVQGWPLKRRLMSRAVNLYARWLLGLRPKDCSGA